MSNSTCDHTRADSLEFSIKHVWLVDVKLHIIELSVKCKLCSKDLIFRCDQMGFSASRPRTDVDKKTITLPCITEGDPSPLPMPEVLYLDASEDIEAFMAANDGNVTVN